MCKELEAELGLGKEAAEVLVKHLKDMGASNGMIPVTTEDGEFEVTVKPKKKDTGKPKMGMYDETPQIHIGNIMICDAQLPTNGNVWMEDDEFDGGEFPKDKVYDILKSYYDKNF